MTSSVRATVELDSREDPLGSLVDPLASSSDDRHGLGLPDPDELGEAGSRGERSELPQGRRQAPLTLPVSSPPTLDLAPDERSELRGLQGPLQPNPQRPPSASADARRTTAASSAECERSELRL